MYSNISSLLLHYAHNYICMARAPMLKCMAHTLIDKCESKPVHRHWCAIRAHTQSHTHAYAHTHAHTHNHTQ